MDLEEIVGLNCKVIALSDDHTILTLAVEGEELDLFSVSSNGMRCTLEMEPSE